MFYEYTGEPLLDLPRPGRVYAILDSMEPDEELGFQPETIFLEAIDANAFDEGRISRSELRKGVLDEFVSVVQSDDPYDLLDEFRILAKMGDENRWIEIKFDASSDGVPVLHFLNLFSPPVERRAQARPANRDVARNLDALLDIDDIEDAEEADIKDAISGAGDAGAAVYDVGQGNCNAVLDAQDKPTLYFDFGGGVLGNVSTYPTSLTDFCFSNKPAIVMSHWDWDHWSSALRVRSNSTAAQSGPAYSDAINATWIVPRQTQKLGAVHVGFLSKLPSLFIWPAGLASISNGPVSIHKCSGPGRNHSGLVMEYRPSWAAGRGVLFTGDCDYGHLPAPLGDPSRYDIVVAPHHGGPATNVPSPASAPYQRHCYSYGPGNTFKHPLPPTLSGHLSAGWPSVSRLDTANRSAMMNKRDAGHILLKPNRSVPTGPACGFARCETGFVQS